MKETLDLQSIRQDLEEQRAALKVRVKTELERDTNQKELNPDRYDLAQTYNRRQRDLSLLEQSERCLELIENALKRLDDGTYGFCVQCQGSIAPARLEALPAARLCIRCQQNQEWTA